MRVCVCSSTSDIVTQTVLLTPLCATQSVSLTHTLSVAHHSVCDSLCGSGKQLLEMDIRLCIQMGERHRVERVCVLLALYL